ncbi:MAG TPA: alpha-hydroxy acid oxidase, partial [Stellaceae bacterium]|nr:alpha-hydroxy acid oxidase [Stellaceae bacterium]
RAAEEGADAVAISNHGGRQLDWAAAPLDLLPAARDAVGNRIALIVDGGMRRGSDVLKAVALGADAVFAGRAPLYGVAAAGRAGAARALDILRAEIERDLGLIGAPSLAALDRSRLIRPWPGPSLFPARGGEACADPRERAERAERAGTSQERHPFAGIEHLGRQAQWRLGGHMPPSAISNETWFGLLRSERCRHRAAATACRLGSSGARRRDGPARCGRRVRRRCVYAPAPSPARCRPQRQ